MANRKKVASPCAIERNGQMTDKEYFEGETECPIYGNEHPVEWCSECNLGTDGTAKCPFRKMPYKEGVGDDK